MQLHIGSLLLCAVVCVFIIGTSGQGFTATWNYESNYASQRAGAKITHCDVNGDNYTDLLFTGQIGAYAFYGSASGTFGSTYDWFMNISQTTTNLEGLGLECADVNSDGIDDALIGNWTASPGYIHIYNGSLTGLATVPYAISWTGAGAYFGEMIHVNDFNGDGKKDVAVGAYGAGRVNIYYQANGNFTSYTPSFLAPVLLSYGEAVTSGDFSADGYPDLVVSCRGCNSNVGTVYIYNVNASGFSAASWIVNGTVASAFYGYDVSTGDYNGDGHVDLAVLSQGDKFIYIYYGTGSLATLPKTPSVSISVIDTCRVIKTGNINNDGYDDLLVGCNTNLRVRLYYGGPNLSSSTTAAVAITGTAANTGFAVAFMGNLDNAGLGDIAWGAWTYTNGQTSEGQVTVAYNMVASPSPSASPSMTPTPSVTASVTPSISVSPSQTPSPSVTPSESPSPSVTPSETPSSSVTPSVGYTPSPTASPSTSSAPSVSPSPIPSVSSTPTPSVTPSVTPTSSPSVTPSVTPSPVPSTSSSPSVTPSISPIPPSPSPSSTPSVSSSPSSTPSISPTPSISVSPTSSVSPGSSPSTSPSVTPSISVSPSGTPSASRTPSPSPSALPSSSPSSTASPTPSSSPSVSPSSVPSVSPSSAISPSPSSTPSISVAIVPSSSVTPSTSPEVDGLGKSSGGKGSSTIAIAVAVPVGAVAIIAFIGAAVWYKKTHPKYRTAKKVANVELKDVERGGSTSTGSAQGGKAATAKPSKSTPSESEESESESDSESGSESESDESDTDSSDVTSSGSDPSSESSSD